VMYAIDAGPKTKLTAGLFMAAPTKAHPIVLPYRMTL
jgi:hypothetical protein